MANLKKETQKDTNNFLQQRNPDLNSRIQDYWLRTNRTQNHRMTQNKMDDN